VGSKTVVTDNIFGKCTFQVETADWQFAIEYHQVCMLGYCIGPVKMTLSQRALLLPVNSHKHRYALMWLFTELQWAWIFNGEHEYSWIFNGEHEYSTSAQFTVIAFCHFTAVLLSANSAVTWLVVMVLGEYSLLLLLLLPSNTLKLYLSIFAIHFYTFEHETTSVPEQLTVL